MPPAATITAVERVAYDLWPREFEQKFQEDVVDAGELCVLARLGRAPRGEGEALDALDQLGSSPIVWSAFWRTRADGRTGCELAARSPRLKAPVLRAAVARIADARVTYSEVLSVDVRTESIVIRDLFTGTKRVLLGVEQLVPAITRWARLFTCVVDVGDGTSIAPTAVVSHPAFAELPPDELVSLVTRAVEGVTGVAVSATTATADRALLPWFGVAMAAIHRYIHELPRPTPAKRHLVTTDGERVEFHRGQIRPSADERARLLAALPHAEDFLATDAATWSWYSRTHTAVYAEGESLGVVEAGADGLFLHAPSAQRFERLGARLAELAGASFSTIAVEVVRPWEGRDDVVAEEAEGVERVVVAQGVVPAASLEESKEVMAGLFLANMRRAADRHVEAVGGVPREVVKTPEGRAAVEAWIRDAESTGQPRNGGEIAFVDLDVIRAELGLEVVGGGGGVKNGFRPTNAKAQVR